MTWEINASAFRRALPGEPERTVPGLISLRANEIGEGSLPNLYHPVPFCATILRQAQPLGGGRADRAGRCGSSRRITPALGVGHLTAHDGVAIAQKSR